MTINPTSGAVTWSPAIADIGNHLIDVQATDSRGAAADQKYTLHVAPTRSPPKSSSRSTRTWSNIGDQVTFHVQATDNVAVRRAR